MFDPNAAHNLACPPFPEPRAKIKPFRQRMKWSIPWHSSFDGGSV